MLKILRNGMVNGFEETNIGLDGIAMVLIGSQNYVWPNEPLSPSQVSQPTCFWLSSRQVSVGEPNRLQSLSCCSFEMTQHIDMVGWF